MTTTPKGFRLHLGVFGRRNAGKSTLVNLAAGQQVSIVSDTPGTTTDPVEKPMEFPPLGPVVWIDTAGIDDKGELGGLRTQRSRSIIDRTDLAIIVFAGKWRKYEQRLHDEFSGRGVPVLAVANKSDEFPDVIGVPEGMQLIRMSAGRGEGLEALRQAIVALAPAEFVESPTVLRDLVAPGSILVLVTPIDSEAPKGRLILPQVQALRDALDGDCISVVTKETTLAAALNSLKAAPDLVVTDSQAFKEVAKIVPPSVKLTGFSVLFARMKGDLAEFARGAKKIGALCNGDRILVAESCTHHQQDDDIGRVKLPALLRKRSGAELEFEYFSGHDFPEDLASYKLVLHCGACMTNRRLVLSRLARCRAAGVGIVNYGLAIAYCLGLLERALEPFPEALAAYKAE